MSGSVLAVGLVGAAATLALVLGASSEIIVEQVRIQAAADQIALIAEDAQRGLATGFPCELAGQWSQRFGYELDTCRILNCETWIALKSVRMGIVINARAHAGS